MATFRIVDGLLLSYEVGDGVPTSFWVGLAGPAVWSVGPKVWIPIVTDLSLCC